MDQRAAEQRYLIATDIHIVRVPAPPAPAAPTPLPHPFTGIIDDALSPNVNIMRMRAATLTSIADNTPPHLPTPPGITFVLPPTNKGIIIASSPRVFINNKPGARNCDTALTCNDPVPLPVGRVVAVGAVFIG